jgi:hypothetical protein
MGVKDDLIYDCNGCESYAGLFPVMDKKAIADGVISTYIGQFQVKHSNEPIHRIKIPPAFSLNWMLPKAWGVYRGITFTRL